MPRLLLRVLLLAVLAPALWAGGRSVRAQSASGAQPVSLVLADRDGDLVTDAVGDTVTVAGRITMGSGQLHRNWTEVFLQDATGGIKLVASSAAPPVAEGDSVIARGVVEHQHGMAQLTDPVYQVVRGPERMLTPEPIDLRETTLEAVEGRLVEMKGTVVARGAVEAGEHLIVLVHDQLVVVFAYSNRSEPITFDAFEVGDYVRLRGIAAQFDRAPPYDGSYQLFPRTAADVAMAGLPPVFYRVGLSAIAVLFLLALAWVMALRRQVRKRVAQLRATETRYAHLLSSAGDAVFVHSPDTGTIEEVNEVATETLGFSAPQLLRRTLGDLVAPDGHQALGQHLDHLARFGGALDVIPLRNREGATVPFEFRSRQLALDGTRVVLSIARDVAARQAYERGLIEARQEAEHAREEAESMARLRSAFLANMSHEIRTPLTAIIGFAQILHEEVDADQQEFTTMIERGGTRLLDTLTAVLDLARLDAGHTTLQPEPVDVLAEVHRAVAPYREAAHTKDLALHVDANVPSLVAHHDPTVLSRVLHHLVDNALKFTNRGAVRLTLRAEANVFHIDVADTGVGIDAAFLPNLFSAFQQESEGFGRSHEGTGLGLTLVQRFVELMGGTITVQSRKGLGTRFTITLPRTMPAPKPALGGDGAVQRADRADVPVATFYSGARGEE